VSPGQVGSPGRGGDAAGTSGDAANRGAKDGAGGSGGTTSESKGSNKTSTAPAPAAWTTEACATRRDDAAAARKAGSYEELDRLLGKKECWSDGNAWLVLRVRTDLELGRYDACVKAGKKSTDPKVQSVVQTCLAKQGG
jgi:hypothetical protein